MSFLSLIYLLVDALAHFIALLYSATLTRNERVVNGSRVKSQITMNTERLRVLHDRDTPKQ